MTSYYVKGQQTNRASLWRSGFQAYPAQALGSALPFSLVQLDPALVRELPSDLQAGSLPASARARWCTRCGLN